MDEVPQGGAGGVPLDDDSQESRRRRPGPSHPREADRARSRSTAGRDGEGGDALTPNTEAQEETARKGRQGKDRGAH
ncbi:hypothetical protein ACIQUQ_20355 [Streptomyces sp. NPDC101118]|uniref:hypothetical protein n=1 Tax=Streptomyces sp. NPDC101118 TaxID=3366109 RepID=UPI00382A64B9